jgi:hypothetical protein|tara:strand:- start:1245 stop:3173 length:1929 start_codon:yes stop_codon:yes gene_type:complete
MSPNNTRCGVDGNTIYYDTKTIDLKSTPTGKTAFEAIFLSDVISEISGQCFIVQENCKTLYPEITNSNWKDWITSVDQENRMSLAHTLEKSDIPILYNTPRLCDPGVSISKNWSLRNYIETRLYLFKFKYNYGKTPLKRNTKNCYPSILFDFRPFQYKLALPVTADKKAPGDIVVTEYITVESTSGAEGYTPHMSFSKNGIKTSRSSTVIFDAMVKKLISTPLGSSNKSIINQKLVLGPNNRNVNQSFLNNFRKFIEDYDGAQFDPPIILNRNKSKPVPTIKLTDDVIRVLFYDLYHDKVVTKNDFSNFRSQFKYQFRKSIDFDTTSFAGAKSTGKAYNAYGDIFFTGEKELMKNSEGKTIKQIPAICKTLGDLSQFIYAAKYNTVVASGDKMGIATGLYINATMNRQVKCMMEDVITGFIIYSGLPTINFIRKTTCASATNGGACTRNGKTNKKDIQNRILRSVPSNKINYINTIIKSKPKGIKRLLTLIGNSAKSQTINSVKETLNTLNKSYTYLNDTNLNKIIRILNVYNNKPNLRPLSTKIAEFKGKIQAQIETNKSQVGTKTNRNNNGNANRTTKKVTTGNDTKSANRVNRIRPFIMKMSHLTNNQKAYYINQAKTNNTKLLSEIVKNARLRAYRRT